MFLKFLKLNVPYRKRIPGRQFSVLRKDVWTNDRIVKSPCRDIEIPKVTVDEYIWKNLDRWPTKQAVVCGVTNRSYTYEELYKRSKVFGANLRMKFKIENGDTVAVMMRNSPEYPILVLGILASGGIVTTFNPIYTAYEVERLISLSEAKLFVVDPDIAPIIKTSLKSNKKDLPIIVADTDVTKPEGTISYREVVEDANVDLSILKNVNRKHDDIAFLPFSSGTTGLPKAVELTNFNIVANCEQQNTELKHYNETTGDYQDSSLLVLPMFHSYGQGVLMLHKLSVGLKLVTLPKFQIETVSEALLRHQFNLLYLAPPMVLFLASHPSITSKHFERLRIATCGAAPLPTSDIHNFMNKVSRDIHFGQGYGMTEASPLVSLSAQGQKQYDSVGFAISNIELRVVDEHMKNLGPGEMGELVIRGPNIMKGYKNNPDATKEVFLEGGWYRSGDSAKINDEGLITIFDRLKELIKVNAYQVSPAELENVLKEHPDIFDAGVIGVPDAITGERPKAFVVLRDGARTTDKQIIEFVRERVAPYKKIKEVRFLNSLPKNLTGKILRKTLKDEY